MNYIRPDNGQGIRIYEDGVLTDSEVTKSGGTYSAGDGREVVGRPYTYQASFYASVDVDESFYASVDVDELLFFNQKLSDQQIMDIRNLA